MKNMDHILYLCSLFTLLSPPSFCAPSSELFSWEKKADDLTLESALNLYSDEEPPTIMPALQTTAVRVFTNLREFEDKRTNVIMFGINDTEQMNSFILRKSVIRILRLTNIPFDDSEIIDVKLLSRVREYASSPVLVKFSSAQLQRAVMYNKDRVHPIKLEFDLTKRTIEKQKRLLPLRNRMLNEDIACFIKLGKLYAKGRPLQSQEVTELAEYYGIQLSTLSITHPPI